MNKILILLLATLSCSIYVAGHGNVLTCYVVAWSIYRPAQGKFDIEDIDPHLCTHIIYSYSQINATTYKVEGMDLWADINLGNLEKLLDLKEENPKLKIMTSVGGWNEGSERFSKICKDRKKRETFIASAVEYLSNNKMDGLDIDWQFPTQRGGKKYDKHNFVTLLKEMREEFDKKGYILTVRLIGQTYVATPGYDLKGISDAVHYINLKSYEYHGSWEPRTGVFAPLQSQNEDSVEFSISYFLDEGVPREKLLLGLSTTGNAFLIDEQVNNGIYLGQKAKESFKGPWVSQDGILGFNEICYELTTSRLWTQYWDKISATPYAIHGKRFTSFENKDSFEEKLKLVEEKSLGGVSIHSLDTDDFKGLCYNQKFILTNTAKTQINLKPSPSKPVDSEEVDKVTFEASILTQEFPRK